MASTVLPNGIIIPEKFSRDWYADLYHNWQELDNLLGGGTPKDGTLTIQKNGDTVGTFSANQATNETINITVPTKTSDLTNDSDFVQSSDLATVATSGSYNDLSNKPTIPTVNNATLTIQRNGTTVDTFTANASVDKTININTADDTKIPLAGSNQISGDLIPSTDGTANLGSSTNKWKSLNGINPGALSLPSISSSGANAWIALDTTNWVKSPVTSTAQKYTPPADGWLNIRVNNATMLGLAITGGGNYMHQMIRSETPNGLALLIPVFKNKEVAILVAGNENLAYDRSTFYPCQGNV